MENFWWLWQVMKPVYQQCMETGMQHAARQAANHIAGPSTPNNRTGVASTKVATKSNGKVKKSWYRGQLIPKTAESPEQCFCSDIANIITSAYLKTKIFRVN